VIREEMGKKSIGGGVDGGKKRQGVGGRRGR